MGKKKKVPVKKKSGSEIVTKMYPDHEKLKVPPLEASLAATAWGKGLLRNGLSGGFLIYGDVYKRHLRLAEMGRFVGIVQIIPWISYL